MTPSKKIRGFFTPDRIAKYDLNKIESLAGVEIGTIELILSEKLNDELTNEVAKELLLVTQIIKHEDDDFPFDTPFIDRLKKSTP